ncbi:restriction endonuclease [Leptospira idonii]|uniref:Restriction endonuclease type IV Mrr domain-containing protein n=1 Tax=Leptospira idonii TaxID=1193500 RepID=A0A4R9LWF3_9LEPT|nr:restriction endonuclease [Leptospira idonii]TGN17488.1 hypothetical protein EHS15_17010 [Leptospira idonii]
MEKPGNILFIKLGNSGSFEKESIEINSSIKLGYEAIDFIKCKNGQWEDVLVEIKEKYKTEKSSTTSHRNQIRKFFEEPKTTMWVTFYQSKLWYCYADEEILLNPDGTKERKTIKGWKDIDLHNNTLFIQNLSGRLTKVQGFRGTICDIKEKEYLLNKINGLQSAEHKSVELNLAELRKSLISLIKKLNPNDFENFVDLLFRSSGWSRIGVLGKTTKNIDIELISPITNERAIVQVKAQSNLSIYKDYLERLDGFEQDYEKVFFVTHSPTQDLEKYIKESTLENFIFYDANKLSELSVNAGLIEWLINVAN